MQKTSKMITNGLIDKMQFRVHLFVGLLVFSALWFVVTFATPLFAVEIGCRFGGKDCKHGGPPCNGPYVEAPKNFGWTPPRWRRPTDKPSTNIEKSYGTAIVSPPPVGEVPPVAEAPFDADLPMNEEIPPFLPPVGPPSVLQPIEIGPETDRPMLPGDDRPKEPQVEEGIPQLPTPDLPSPTQQPPKQGAVQDEPVAPLIDEGEPELPGDDQVPPADDGTDPDDVPSIGDIFDDVRVPSGSDRDAATTATYQAPDENYRTARHTAFHVYEKAQDQGDQNRVTSRRPVVVPNTLKVLPAPVQLRAITSASRSTRETQLQPINPETPHAHANPLRSSTPLQRNHVESDQAGSVSPNPTATILRPRQNPLR